MNTKEYSGSLNNLGSVYCNMGLIEKGLPFILESLQVLKNSSGENTTDYALYLNNLTGVYENLQQYEKAEPLILQKSKIIRSNLQNNFINL